MKELNVWERARASRQSCALSQSESMQEECIAHHYVALAQLSLQIMALIETRKRAPSRDVDDTIKYLTGVIRATHLSDFGIELEWRILEK
jgi:hypothetical protein